MSRAYSGEASKADDFAALWDRADRAGRAAAEPIPDAGTVGFGWIEFDGRSRFARWAKGRGLTRTSYPTGLRISSPVPKQAIDANEAWAKAVAVVLNEAGVRVFARSRMD